MSARVEVLLIVAVVVLLAAFTIYADVAQGCI